MTFYMTNGTLKHYVLICYSDVLTRSPMNPKYRIAIQLRRKGKSYSQIKQQLAVSKGTLSRWLHEYPLSREQLRSLRDLSAIRIEKYRKTMQAKRARRLAVYYQEEKRRWLPFSQAEMCVAGLFLYWGEGSKVNRGDVSISNADPSVMQFAVLWMTRCLGIPREDLRVRAYLYSDMNVARELSYWSAQLKLPLRQFATPQVVPSRRTRSGHLWFQHGTCCVYVYDSRLKEHIQMALRAVGDYYSGRGR